MNWLPFQLIIEFFQTDALFLTVRLFFRRKEISLLFNTYIGLVLKLLFLTKYIEIYAAENFLWFKKREFIYQTCFLLRKSPSCIFFLPRINIFSELVEIFSIWSNFPLGEITKKFSFFIRKLLSHTRRLKDYQQTGHGLVCLSR